MVRLAAAYATAVLGLNEAQAKRLIDRVCGSSAPTLAFALKLQALGEQQGAFAIALVHKLFNPVWTAQQSTNAAAHGEAKRKNELPNHHRLALVEALRRMPAGIMDDLIRAADNAEGLEEVCKRIKSQMDGNADYKAFNKRFPKELHHALQRLRGKPYFPNPLAYNGAGPMHETLEWLKRLKERQAPL
jgi:hypothetical protein